MPIPALASLGGALGSLFGGGSQATANNAFQSTLSVTPIISIGGSVGAETLAGGSSDASATPTFSQSAVPGVLGAPTTTGTFTPTVSPDLSASFASQNSSLSSPLILGGIGLVGAAIFFFGGK